MAASALSILFSFTVGYYDLPASRIFELFGQIGTAQPTSDYIVLMRVRLPRILSAFLIGAALSVSGASYQGMFKNPLVSPDILGVASGAGFGASLAIFLGMSSVMVQTMAFIAGLGAAFLSFLISSRVKYGQTVSLILAGTMIGALCMAATTMLKYLADTSDTLPAITFWLMGSLVKVDMKSLLFSLVPMAVGFVLLFLMRWRLNVLTLGDEEAQSLGVNPRRTRFMAIVGATLLSSAAVCLGGLIGWVGLMIPHITRGLVGPQYKKTFPVCILLGGCFLLLVDDLSRGVSALEIPIGVLTAFVGAPFFIWLILRRKGEQV
ncbi:iron ABC transporter permease [Christensenellaceae bacterium OttesenSCG-928-K19]|nr:iron ABC transporter permease [Christensenellaceae bacterium OttesenSCG-928-K19]